MPEERLGVEAYFGVEDFRRNTSVYDKILTSMDKHTANFGRSVERSTVGMQRSWKGLYRTHQKTASDTGAVIANLRKQYIAQGRTVRTTTKQSASDYERFSKSIIGQTMKMRMAIDAAKFAFRAFTQPFKQFIAIGMEAVGIQRTQRMFTRMVGGVEAYEDALIKMRTATRGTIKDTALISSAFRIMNMGLAATAERAAVVARNVTLLGKASGQVPTPQAAMQVFALMMSNQSKMRLDAFNLTIGETDARIAHLKETMGVSQEEAFRLAVFELMDEKVKQMGLDVEDASTQVSRMGAEFTNLTDNLKTMIVPEFNDFADVLESIAGSFNVNKEAIEEWYVVVVGSIRGVMDWWGDYAKAVILLGAVVKEALTGNIEGAKALFETYKTTLGEIVKFTAFFEAIDDAARKHYDSMAVSAEDSAQRQADALKQAADDAGAAVATMRSEWDEKVAAAAQEAEKKTTAMMIKETYVAVDAIIAASRRREDIARQTAKQLQQIESQLTASMTQASATYESAIENAAKQHADARLRVEENYQTALRNIQRKFVLAEGEAIRSRDALSLVKARRTRDDELSEARRQRDEQMSQAGRQYAEQLDAARKNLTQQEEAARESYRKQIAQLEQSLKEQEEEKEISDRRKAEDAKRARARELGSVKTYHGQLLSEFHIQYAQELADAKTHYDAMLAQAAIYRSEHHTILTGRAAPSFGVPPEVYMAKGGAFIATRPTRVVVGDDGPEYVMARPMKDMSPQTMNVNHLVTGQVQAQVQAVIQQSIAGIEGRIGAAVNNALMDVFRGIQ